MPRQLLQRVTITKGHSSFQQMFTLAVRPSYFQLKNRNSKLLAMSCLKLKYEPEYSPLYISGGVNRVENIAQGFMSTDPLKDDYPYYSSYQYAGNKPIIAIDIDGLESSANIGQQRGSGGRARRNKEARERAEQARTEGKESPAQRTERMTKEFGSELLKMLMSVKIGETYEGFRGESAEPLSKEVRERHSLKNTIKQLDPNVQIENFSRSVVTGTFNLVEGFAEGDGRKLARAVPFVAEVIGTIYGARVPTSRLNPAKTPSLSKATINSSIKGLDVRPASFINEIPKGATIEELVDLALYETRATGLEHAVIQLENGTRHLISGGKHGIELPLETDILFGHTHPPLRKGELNTPSPADRKALDQLDQSKQYIFHDGQRTTIYRGKGLEFDATTTNY